jgi:hypothetical protein
MRRSGGDPLWLWTLVLAVRCVVFLAAYALLHEVAGWSPYLAAGVGVVLALSIDGDAAES